MSIPGFPLHTHGRCCPNLTWQRSALSWAPRFLVGGLCFRAGIRLHAVSFTAGVQTSLILFFFLASPPGSLDGQLYAQFMGEKARSLPLDSGLIHVLHTLLEALDLGS